MKLEKREITLNEADSLKDMVQTEKNTLIQYATLLTFPLRKQVQNVLLKNMKEGAEGLADLQMVLQGVLEEQV